MSTSAVNRSTPCPETPSTGEAPSRSTSGNYEDIDGDTDIPENFLCPEVYLSLVWHGGHLGVAYYDLTSLQLHVMNDSLEKDNFTITKQVLKEIQPSVIVVSSVQDVKLISFLKKAAQESLPHGSKNEPFKIEFLPNSDFNFQVSKRRILSLKLPAIPDHFTEEERKMYFASIVSLDQICMVRAAGGLSRYLEKKRIGVELEDAMTPVPILGLRTFTLENHIHIDRTSYLALSIFDTEIHPSVYKMGGGSGKEGLSLFGILNRCKSSIGSKMLRQWFLRPVKNAAVLIQRHDAVDFFSTPRHQDVVSDLEGCLKNVKYLPKILWRMSNAQATVDDLLSLCKTTYFAAYIGNISRAQPQSVEIFRKIAATFTDALNHCERLLHQTVDFEESKKQKKFVVKPNLNGVLDEKKRLLHGLPDILRQVAREELQGLSGEIPTASASYLPQIGYLLAIDMPEGMTEDDDHTIEGLQFVFAINNQLFYRSPRTRELDNQLGDLVFSISDMEVDILQGLQSAILENTQVLLDVMELAAELDCLMALARCATEFNYVRPKLVQEDVINIKAGRHPLQEMCCSPFVPNDTVIGCQGSRIHLLTGPNACGKSVYLKQVALIVFMSHIGSFVPAQDACIGPVDCFFTRIKSMESVSCNMSTFMQDSLQMSSALNMATHQSLVIVDEFGKGTESTDGLALLTAILKFWLVQGATSPYVLLSTHYHGIIQQQLLPKSSHIEFWTLETMMNGNELVFLYHLKRGFASSSYACHNAALVGMPSNIVNRGKQVSELLSQYKAVPHMQDSKTMERLKLHKSVVDDFMKLDLAKDEIQPFMTNIVKRVSSYKKSRDLKVNSKVLSPENRFKKTSTEEAMENLNASPLTELMPTYAQQRAPSCINTSNAKERGEVRSPKVYENGSIRARNSKEQCHKEGEQPLKVDVSRQKIVNSSEHSTTSSKASGGFDMNLIAKKRAAVRVLEGCEMSSTLEHFNKTPIVDSAIKKQKIDVIIRSVSSSSTCTAKSSPSCSSQNQQESVSTSIHSKCYNTDAMLESTESES